MEEALERRNAECEFVRAAYSEEEAWVTVRLVDAEGTSTSTTNSSSSSRSSAAILAAATATTVVQRRLRCTTTNANGDSDEAGAAVSFVLDLLLPADYPVSACLAISAIVQEDQDRNTCSNKTAAAAPAGGHDHCYNNLLKAAHSALPDLLQVCRQAAASVPGEEAIFTVFSRADEWMQESWPTFYYYNCSSKKKLTAPPPIIGSNSISNNPRSSVVLGRNLIYSHHIIGKKKRADMKDLASGLKLTGYCKIGWPGIILIEGREEACHAFYDRIRRWAWQHLVLRGEMREDLGLSTNTVTAAPANDDNDDEGSFLDARRKFRDFVEVDDMSIVASHCRQVGLESSFLTSMKVYSHNNADDETNSNNIIPPPDCDEILYGALIHVDHMNDGKAYRKWLRKTCHDLDITLLLLKQCYPDHDYVSKRPLIVVGLVGSSSAVSAVFKKWRTSHVDVDSRGKSCRERMMKVLVEGDVAQLQLFDGTTTIRRPSCSIGSWDDLSSESHLNTTKEKLIEAIRCTGIQAWVDAVALL